MPIINNAHTNPLSTYAAYGPNTRGPQGGDANSYVFKDVAASGTAVLPKIETFPASFLVTSTGTSNQPVGIVHATAAGNLIVSGASSHLSATDASGVLVPTISSGVITFTANGTFSTRDIVVTRIG